MRKFSPSRCSFRNVELIQMGSKNLYDLFVIQLYVESILKLSVMFSSQSAKLKLHSTVSIIIESIENLTHRKNPHHHTPLFPPPPPCVPLFRFYSDLF